ncbi:MAG: DnaJ domain-containing protein [Thermoanaerobaculia bacterium]|nr:DnaJ domain-containing protein [Thermoanaerobaculia bacterium]
MNRDYYQVLAVARGATPEQIRARFRELARERHPDRFRGEERARAEREFQEITEAFNVLTNPERRRAHDLDLARPAASNPGSDKTRLMRFHLEAGVGFYRDGNYFAAAESFDRALHLDPRNHQALHHLAQSLAHQRKFLPRAVEAIVRACELQPMNVGYLKLAGRLHVEAGLPEKAERYYNQALTWGGEDPAVTMALEELQKGTKKARGSAVGRNA